MKDSGKKYLVKLTFEEIKLPPFQEILILGTNCTQGKIGISKSCDLLLPNEFEMVELKEGNVEAVLINKKILVKMSVEKVLKILREKVFPFVSDGELVKVDFRVSVSYDQIEEK